MFCMNCGTKLPDGAKFCLSCGSPTGTAQSITTPANPIESKGNKVISNNGNRVEKNTKEFRPIFTAEDECENISEEEQMEDIIQKENPDYFEQEEEDEENYDETDDEDEDDDADEEDEEDEADDEDDEVNEEDISSMEIETDETESIPDLSGLSVHHDTSAMKDTQTSVSNEPEILTPANDPYWDDVLPEINDELYQIPKDIIVKAIGIVVAVAASIAWLIIMLPN